MRVVSDSSPLITLTRIGRLDILPALHQTVSISTQVYDEIVVAGAGLAGVSEIAAAKWIEVRQVDASSGLSAAARERLGIGVGELSTIVLGRELKADLVLMDDLRARRAARQEGLTVLGCVGVLHDAFNKKLLPDLREAYGQMLASGAYVDRRILDASLKALNLPPL